jgi:hypothetical protein
MVGERSSRLARYLLAYLPFFCAGCSFLVPEFSNAFYDKGIIFSGLGDVIHQVYWQRPKGKAIPCPLVVRLNGKRLGESELASQKFMRALGAEPRNEFQNQKELVLSAPGYSIFCRYENEILVAVGLNAYANAATTVEVSVDGKDLTLPMTENELFRRMGKPRDFIKAKPP